MRPPTNPTPIALVVPFALMAAFTVAFMAAAVNGVVSEARAAPLAEGGYDPDRHIEAPGQGAQDPARSEVLEGRSRDMPRCLSTLTARRETEQEAREVCNKILHDLGE